MSLDLLLPEPLDGPSLGLARDYAPVLMLDRGEPFRPVAVGVTLHDTPGASNSSKVRIAPRGTVCLEYTIYWDWDIGHLYDLEHIWVHLNEDEVLAVEASHHGERIEIDLQLQDGRPVVWCQAGKHAHLASRAHRDRLAAETRTDTRDRAGIGGVHLGNPFVEQFGAVGSYQNRLARLYLARRAFTPALGDGLPCDLADVPLCAWGELAVMIPRRVRQLLRGLETDMPHFKALFLDCGDTLVDEGTEVKRPDGSDVVTEADLIPGAREFLEDLEAQGYRLCLVADGPRETFENVLGQHRLWDMFEAHVISGDVGVRKPDPAMFRTALARMMLDPEDAPCVPMVGNNLDRDILGANRAGHPSIFFNWSDRRRRTPDGPEDTPTAEFGKLHAAVDLIFQLEIGLDTEARS